MSSIKTNIEKNCKYSIMQRYAAVLTIICVFICLSSNNTFPLHRGQSDWHKHWLANSSSFTEKCNKSSQREDFVERTKHMASNIESALKRIKDSTHDFGRNIYNQVNNGIKSFRNSNALNEEEIREYEQMVIMKKYPYLDLKELEQKYIYSPNVNVRQTVKIESGPNPISSIYEPSSIDESPNVEITNRGLSGFAIPPQLSKRVNIVENKLKFNNLNDQEHLANIESSRKINTVENLKRDVLDFIDRRNKSTTN